MKRHFKCILLICLFFLMIKTVYANEHIHHISRLQLRQSNMGNLGWSQSTFIQWPNKFYFLNLLEHQYNADVQQWHLDVIVGQPLPDINEQRDLFSWVARGQEYSGITPVMLRNPHVFQVLKK